MACHPMKYVMGPILYVVFQIKLLFEGFANNFVFKATMSYRTRREITNQI